jgi:OOP family OmpA-OmpF porin
MFRFLAISIVLVALNTYAQEERVMIIQGTDLMKSVFFGGGSWYVNDVQQQELKQFLEGFEDLSKYQITIHSHTDNIGGVEYNRWLSQMRSQSVLELLLLNDIPMDQITIESFGLKNPLYDNKTFSGKRMNRRVDVVLWPISF